MTDLDLNLSGPSLEALRRQARSAHVRRAQYMLVAAGLASLFVVAVAGALLSQVG